MTFEETKEKYADLLSACKNTALFGEESTKFLTQMIYVNQNHKNFTDEEWDKVGKWIKDGNKNLGFYIANNPDVSINALERLLNQKIFSYEQRFELLGRTDASKQVCEKIFRSTKDTKLHLSCVFSKKENKLNQYAMDIVLKNATPVPDLITISRRSMGLKEYSLSHTANTELIERYLDIMEEENKVRATKINEIDTALIINNENLPDSLRERAESLGYDPQYIITPHKRLLDELYESAAETATNEAMNEASAGYATKFLTEMIKQHKLSPSQELDLAMRLIDMERKKMAFPGELLETLIFETKNEDVFDLYMSVAYGKRNRWEELLYMTNGMSKNNVDTIIIVLLEDMASGKKQTLNDWQYDFIMYNIQGRKMHENVYEAIKLFTDEGVFETANTAPLGISQIQNILKVVASEPHTPESLDNELAKVHQNSISTYVYAKRELQKVEIPYCKENDMNYLGAFEWITNIGVGMTHMSPKYNADIKDSYPIIIKALEDSLQKIKALHYYRAKEHTFGVINTDIDNVLYLTRDAYEGAKRKSNSPQEKYSELLLYIEENGRDVEHLVKNVDEFYNKYNNTIGVTELPKTEKEYDIEP